VPVNAGPEFHCVAVDAVGGILVGDGIGDCEHVP